MKKISRGTHQELHTVVNNVEVRVVKWYDNNSGHLLSTYASAQPILQVVRWDIKKNIQEYIYIN